MPPPPSLPPRGLPSSPRARTRNDQNDIASLSDVSAYALSPTGSLISARLRTRTPSPGQVAFPINPTHTRSRSRPPMPEYPTAKRGNSPNREYIRVYAQSNASSSSSLFSRGGSDSSRTSLDDDEFSKGSRSLRPSPVLTGSVVEFHHSYESIEPRRDELELASQAGTGHSVWNAVAAAASTLTWTVNKTWATTVTTTADEETAPGQESHLTQVMKAYHLQKARELDDLPDWLFPGVKCRSAASPRQEEDDLNDDTSSPPPSAGRRCLREIYRDAAAAAEALPPVPARADRVVRDKPDLYTDGRSKATDRLKALRDAKRNVLAPNQHMMMMMEYPLPVPRQLRPPPGLPSRPVARR